MKEQLSHVFTCPVACSASLVALLSPLSVSFLSPTLPGAVSMHAGEVREWEKKPMREEVEKEQVTSDSYFAFTEFFLACSL